MKKFTVSDFILNNGSSNKRPYLSSVSRISEWLAWSQYPSPIEHRIFKNSSGIVIIWLQKPPTISQTIVILRESTYTETNWGEFMKAFNYRKKYIDEMQMAPKNFSNNEMQLDSSS